MQQPIQIVFREVPHSDAVEAAIQEKVEKLDQFAEHLMSCRVTVGMIQRHKHQGKLYNIRIDLTAPGGEIVVNRDQAEDIYVAIRDAFDHAKRKLEDHIRRVRGDIKTHEPELRGEIARLYPAEGYGFIATDDGGEFYFHRFNVIHPDFEQLEVGNKVKFVEDGAGKEPQASHVSRYEG
ncbi:HPF/RaiA family ribosome-associated protein [Ralstonia sp. UBA689]|uniref:HPF/RaiA family ribosome-associated protein n=1 Tax=Ralstonia sp. UBA689 TaxID=1947373 RepID=UPI0025CC1D54|nr:HPF/RaiA family ribosome-associated protein [Ralstonia sp. UBA689]